MNRLISTREYIKHVQSMEEPKASLTALNRLEHRVYSLEQKLNDLLIENKPKIIYLIRQNDYIKHAVIGSKEDAQKALATISKKHCEQYSGMYDSVEAYWNISNWHLEMVSVYERS